MISSDYPNVSDLIADAKASFEKALELLEREDYYDAAEKAWRAIEAMRKAVLVAAKIPYQYAKTVNIGLPLFSDFLRNINKKRVLDLYDKLAYRLHILGFYEGITSFEEIRELIISDVKILLRELEQIVKIAEKVDLREALESFLRIQKLKRKIMIHHAELIDAKTQYLDKLSLSIAKVFGNRE